MQINARYHHFTHSERTSRPPVRKRKKRGRALKGPPPNINPFLRIVLFCRMNCFRRTNVCASTTFGASLRVDRVVLVTCRNSANRALVNPSTASYTIVTNYVSHDSSDLINELELKFGSGKGKRFPRRLCTISGVFVAICKASK